MARGYLVLENGSIFAGEMLGGPVNVDGEAVFNTSMNGYQEIITDPSYAGQILVFTYPSIGNYGCSAAAFESSRPALRALVVKEIALRPDHCDSRWTLPEFLEHFQVPCLTGVDTRALTRILRIHGTMGAVMSSCLDDPQGLVQAASRGRDWLERGLAQSVSCDSPRSYGHGDTRIALLDFGVKRSIIKSLVARGCQVVAMPADSTAEEVLACNPRGVVLSNGPGNPEACAAAVTEIKKLLEAVPTFGICLGHQLIALAIGARTYKMKFGHRGGNHTVKDLRSGRCLITAQNHSYAVDPASIPAETAFASFINLNDGSVEGMILKDRPVRSVQFHPEAAPGPHDSGCLFDEFLQVVEEWPGR